MKDIKNVKCPWCGKEFPSNKITRHINTTCKNKPKNISEVELIDSVIKAIFGDIVNDILKDYQNLFSLPDLLKKYGISYELSKRLIKCHGIKLRTLGESAKKITAKKIKDTCIETYGVENVSQLNNIKLKKQNTFIKHYGVDNIWKTEEYKNFTRERWNNYNEDEKTKLIKGLINKHRSGNTSKLEKRVLTLLKDLGINFESQFKIGKYFHRYDVRISGTKTLLEINGDFWHGNPKLYKENDILNFSKTNHPKVKDIWKKDEKNRNFAEKNGYKIIYLWENDITNKNDIELGKFLIDILNK